MAKKKLAIKMVSYGLYTPFEKEAKGLPELMEFSTTIPARLGVEFGYILNIKGGRGELLEFRIDHPPFINAKTGEMAEPFDGEFYVRTSDFNFFLGDTFWEPLEDKKGKWTLTTWWNDQEIAKKVFTVE
ncbi:MAG: DUF3859 domain-containing protein [Phycisphaerae bacterium]|nr:DUF3859 domain-containing protein [Phycisphaerae bacterium]